MHRWSLGALLMLLPFIGVRAQNGLDQDLAALRSDLCRCMEALDPEAPGVVYERGFRACLGDAVIRHPSEVRSLLRSASAEGSAGYRLGLAIGELMGDDCVAYVRARDHVRSLHRRAVPAGGT